MRFSIRRKYDVGVTVKIVFRMFRTINANSYMIFCLLYLYPEYCLKKETDFRI
jgi:hypothetical protein